MPNRSPNNKWVSITFVVHCVHFNASKVDRDCRRYVCTIIVKREERCL